MVQHVSDDTPPIIRSSKTVIAASGFTYVFSCRLPLRWLTHPSGRQPNTYVKPEAAMTVLSSWWWAVCRPKHVEPLRNNGLINSTTRLHLVGSFYEIWIISFSALDLCLWVWKKKEDYIGNVDTRDEFLARTSDVAACINKREDHLRRTTHDLHTHTHTHTHTQTYTRRNVH